MVVLNEHHTNHRSYYFCAFDIGVESGGFFLVLCLQDHVLLVGSSNLKLWGGLKSSSVGIKQYRLSQDIWRIHLVCHTMFPKIINKNIKLIYLEPGGRNAVVNFIDFHEAFDDVRCHRVC